MSSRLGKIGQFIRHVAMDLGPLRQSRQFRLLFIGQTVSGLGSSIAMVALPYQVYVITGSPLKVGLLGAAELVPLFVCSIIGGSIADASDRRKLLLWILTLQTASSGFLAWHSAGNEQLWVLYVMSAVAAGLFGLAIPARRSWAPRLVRPDQLTSAAALEAASFTASHLVGPAIGGIALATIGIAATYALDAASFIFALVTVGMLAPSPPSEHAPQAGFRSVAEGWNFLRGRKVLQGGFWIDLSAMVFGMPKALFPAVAFSLGGGPKTLGLLYAAPAAGAFLATATSGWTSHIRRQGLGVAIAVVAWGLANAAFGLTSSLWVAVAMLAVSGAADMISGVFRMAIVQEVTPDHLRGRLSGMEIAIYAGGPTLGDVESGVVAGLTSVRFSIVSGGLACLVGAAVVAWSLPEFIRYDRQVAAQERARKEAATPNGDPENNSEKTLDGTAELP